VLKHTLK